ncbi:MAG: isocitrate lyase/PEP mutase family protein [Chloroflexi bacterium]|nr:isocitrate lyase/PEP mutase family protein [Chloroflexota bacterium]
MGNGKGDRLRELLKAPEVLILPGGFSPMMAKMVENIGYDTFFMAGSHTGTYLWGLPDVGFLNMTEMADHARRVAEGCSIPVIADADTGFGNALNVYRAVREYARTGVAGMTIEDQEAPKKGQGKQTCISAEEAIGKYQAAKAAKESVGSDLVIFARCDFIRAEGGSFEAALDRCIRYAEEGGADAVWMTGIASREQIKEASAKIPVPLLAGYGGPRPGPTVDEMQELGASAALYRTLTIDAGLQAQWEFLNDFKERGAEAEEDWAQRAKDSKWGRVSNDSLLQLNHKDIEALEEAYLPKA